MLNILRFAVLLAAAAAPAVAGQVAPAPPNRPPLIGSPTIRPDLHLQTSPMLVKGARRQVFDIPDSTVELAVPRLWSNPVRRISVNYPPSALAVVRVRGAIPQACDSFIDRVQLRASKRNGFRLVGYSAEPLAPPPYGHVVQQPLEAIATRASTPDLSTGDYRAADQIRIRPPLYVKQEGANRACWSGYRLTITLEGPSAIADPFATNHPGGGQHGPG